MVGFRGGRITAFGKEGISFSKLIRRGEPNQNKYKNAVPDCGTAYTNQNLIRDLFEILHELLGPHTLTNFIKVGCIRKKFHPLCLMQLNLLAPRPKTDRIGH